LLVGWLASFNNALECCNGLTRAGLVIGGADVLQRMRPSDFGGGLL
jgi:hypothetical protein